MEKVFEKVLELPEDEALALYQSGMKRQIERTSGMFSSMGMPEEQE